MSTTVARPDPGASSGSGPGLSQAELADHWRDEADAAYIYRTLAPRMPDAESARALERLAREEAVHRAYFGRLLGPDADQLDRSYRPSLRARTFVALARVLGPRLVLGMLRQDEGREVARFLREASQGVVDTDFARIAKETAEHAQRLGHLTGVRGDPWHRAEAGGVVRNVVYGFNDGLTANFGLIAGVIGASVSREVILLTGLSGLVASAFSMGASGYLAAQSQREVDANEINVQRAELMLWPEREETYLCTLYQEKGLSEAEARVAAHRVMSDPEVALRELAQEKLGISGGGESPVREGVTTGLATVFGAVVPLVPFLWGGGIVAIAVSFTVSMLAHFVVGAARSSFTGRGWFRSGFDMFAVGLGVAAVGYAVGYLVTGILPAG